MPAPIRVVFTPDEREAVIAEAFRRQAINESYALPGRNGAPSAGKRALQLHLLGAAGEMAVASILGLKDHLYVDQLPTPESSDLPGRIDVKTRSRHSYDLVVQQNEPADKTYVLVTIERREILVHGWLKGHEASKPHFWKDPAGGRPAYFVPKPFLHPLQ